MERILNVGDRFQHPVYGWYEVVRQISGQRFVVCFDETKYEAEYSKYHILDGFVRDRSNSFFHQVGEEYYSPKFGKYTIVELLKGKRAIIEFENTKHRIESFMSNIRKGNVKDCLAPTICGVGCVGVDESEMPRVTKCSAYRIWLNMIKRCYDERIWKNRPTYRDCSVCNEWHNYTNFKEWFDENYIEGCDLDKDILIKGNRVYSPQTCCFVPNEINALFTSRKNNRGNLPLGVQYVEDSRRFKSCYKATFSRGNNKTHIGCYSTPEEAFYAYKEAKEAWIKEVADKWKDKLAPNVYEALYNYEVEITD